MEYQAKSDLLDFLKITSGTHAFALRGLQGIRHQAEEMPLLPSNPDPMMGWSHGDPNVPGEILSRVPGWRRSQLLTNLEHDGVSSLYLGWAWVTLVFDRWEDDFRGRFARKMNCHRNDVMCDAMGDVRHIRNDVTHSKGKATKPESGRWARFSIIGLKIGNLIIIDDRKAADILRLDQQS